MLATTVTTAQFVAIIFWIAAAICFLLSALWRNPPWPGLIAVGLTLLTCGFLTVYWPS
jgi:hypothetical protein